MTDTPPSLCPDVRLNALITLAHHSDEGGIKMADELLLEWPLDPRLHFLKGSILAGVQQYDEARRSIAHAVEITPDYKLARFQLGFLDLTCGRPLDAIGVWAPLEHLPEDEPLRLFAEGLASMTGDHFSDARRLLATGIKLNTENIPLNGDMQLILDEIANLEDPAIHHTTENSEMISDAAEAQNVETTDAPHSAVDLLLRQARFRDGKEPTRH